MSRPTSLKSISADLYGLGGLFFLNALLFGDVLFQSSRVLSDEQGDLFLHFLSWRFYGFSQLQVGHLVLWNPYYLCGNPFFGNFESALLYPPNWLQMVVPMVYALNWITVGHIFLAGAFTYGWGRFRGLSAPAAFIAGTIFMWSGSYYLHLYPGHLPNLCAMVWIPLVFWGLEGILEKGKAGWACLLTLAFSMQILAGHPQYVFFTVCIGILFFIFRISQTDQKGVKTLLALGSLLLAGGVSAVQLITGLEAGGEGLRRLSIDFKMASSFSLPIENILTLVFPELFGNLKPGAYWGRWYPWEVSLFVGLTAFTLAILGWTGKADLRRRADFLLLFSVFVLALGPATPLYFFIYHYCPFANEIRGWAKLDVFIALLIATSAGAGFDFISKEIHSNRGRTRLFAFLGMGLLFLSLGLFFLVQGFPGLWDDLFFQISWLKKTMNSLEPSVREAFGRESGFHLAESLGVGAALFVLLAISFRMEAPWRNRAVLLLCVFELFFFAERNRPTFPISDWTHKEAALGEFWSNHPGEERAYGTSSDSLAVGGRDIWEYEPMVLQRYGQFVASSQGLEDNRLFSVMPVFSKFTPIFGLVRLRYLMNENPARLQFHELPFPSLKRFQLFDQWEVQPSDKSARQALFQPHFDFLHTVILEKNPPFQPEPGKSNGTLDWKEIDSEHIEVRAQVSKPSILLVTDNYGEGWHARALEESGQTQYEVIPGDFFLQAVPLGVGTHHFVLEYKPEAFWLGLRVTEISIFLYLAILYWLWRRRKMTQARIS